MHTIKHIILDFGGVIYDLDGNETSVPAHLAEVLNVPVEHVADIWNVRKEDLLIGKGTPYSFIEWLVKEMKSTLTPAEVFARWRGLYTVKRERIRWDLLKYLKDHPANFHLHLLSNAIDMEEDDVSWKEDVFDGFEGMFRSHSLGLKKPDTHIYTHVLHQIQAQPEECAFLDDLEKNIVAAEKLGIKGFLYNDFASFKTQFEKQLQTDTAE